MTPPQPACRAIVDILTRERPQGPPVRGLPWPCGELPDAEIMRAVMAQARGREREAKRRRRAQRMRGEDNE